MTPLKFIMLHVFAMTNAELAEKMGVSREAISHWKSGRYKLPLETIRPILSAAAATRNLPWNDSWLFEVPVCNACVGPDQCQAGCARIVAACAAIREGDRVRGHEILEGCGGCGHAPIQHRLTSPRNGKPKHALPDTQSEVA
jgi:hypothetical protein